MTDRTESPTWDELDAICKGKSAMDLAEEIWRLRRDGPSRLSKLEDLCRSAICSIGSFDRGLQDHYQRQLDQPDATRENK